MDNLTATQFSLLIRMANGHQLRYLRHTWRECRPNGSPTLFSRVTPATVGMLRRAGLISPSAKPERLTITIQGLNLVQAHRDHVDSEGVLPC